MHSIPAAPEGRKPELRHFEDYSADDGVGYVYIDRPAPGYPFYSVTMIRGSGGFTEQPFPDLATAMRQALVIEYEQESRFIGFQPLQDEASECSAQTGQVIKFPRHRRVRPVEATVANQRVAFVHPSPDGDGWCWEEYSDSTGGGACGLSKDAAIEAAMDYVRNCNSELIISNVCPPECCE